LPYTKVVRKVGKRKAPKTLGEHVRERRLQLGLLQREVAEQIGVGEVTVTHWETNQTSLPPIATMPAIIRFLGYDPTPKAENLSERMKAYRRRHGLPIKEAAAKLGVDEDTWGSWERKGEIPWKRHQALVEAFLDADEAVEVG
jgi:transcriptional regulator with XRE-family HTH domain